MQNSEIIFIPLELINGGHLGRIYTGEHFHLSLNPLDTKSDGNTLLDKVNVSCKIVSSVTPHECNNEENNRSVCIRPSKTFSSQPIGLGIRCSSIPCCCCSNRNVVHDNNKNFNVIYVFLNLFDVCKNLPVLEFNLSKNVLLINQICKYQFGDPLCKLIYWTKMQNSTKHTINSKDLKSSNESGTSRIWQIYEFLCRLFEKVAYYSRSVSLIKFYSSQEPTSSNNFKHRSDDFAQTKYECYSPDRSLSLVGSVQLLILFLCLLAIPHTMNNRSNQFMNENCSTTVASSSPSSNQEYWLPKELNCKTLGTLGLFYTDDANNTSSDNLTEVYFNSTQSLFNYITSFADCWINMLDQLVGVFTCELTRLIMWLESGKPAGLKINYQLAHLMGQFFVYHIIAWRSYVTVIIRLFNTLLHLLQILTEVDSMNAYFWTNITTSCCLIFGTVYLLINNSNNCLTSSSSFIDNDLIGLFKLGQIYAAYLSTMARLIIALFGCLMLDLIEIITLHLTGFHIYTTHLLRFQTIAIKAAWRLCSSRSKWNPLRNRVDTIPDMWTDVLANNKRTITADTPSSVVVIEQGPYFDRLLVATLLGLAIGVCLYSTTIAFYITFTMIQLIIIFYKKLIETIVWFVMDFPFTAAIKWLIGCECYRTKLVMEAPIGQSHYFPNIRMDFVSLNFNEVYGRTHLLQSGELFPPSSTSFKQILNHLLTGRRLRM